MTLSAQSRVLKAVCQGARTARGIAQAAGVDERYIYVHLRRLRAKGKIKTIKVRSQPKEYHLNDIGCLLSEIWA